MSTDLRAALEEAQRLLQLAQDYVHHGAETGLSIGNRPAYDLRAQIDSFLAQVATDSSVITPEPAPALDVDDGRISRQGWHYPRCWELWVGAWYRDEFECICARLAGKEQP